MKPQYLLLFGIIMLFSVQSALQAQSPQPSPPSESPLYDVVLLEDVTGEAKPLTGAAVNPDPFETRNLTSTQLYSDASKAYEADELEKAAAFFTAIIDRGIRNGTLCYNLGNTYFRMGEFGQAVLWFERARKFLPRDADVIHNLAYTRTFLVDKEDSMAKPNGALDALLLLHHQVSVNETLWLLAILSCVTGSLVLLSRLGIGFTRKVLFGYLKGTLWVLLVLQLTSAIYKMEVESNKVDGVILVNSLHATASPGVEEMLVEINAGTKVEVLEVRNGFARIRLPNGTPAFIPEDSIGII